MILKTGKGYYVRDGKKLRKFDLPIGEHPDPIGYTFVEVANQTELDAIVLDKSDAQLAAEAQIAQREEYKKSAFLKLKGLGLNDNEVRALTGA